MQILHILRGMFKGATSLSHFSIMFDWFYPQHFQFIKKCFEVYTNPCDDEVMPLVFKLLFDLVDNTSSRLRFDAWAINGLVLYKESVVLVTEFL